MQSIERNEFRTSEGNHPIEWKETFEVARTENNLNNLPKLDGEIIEDLHWEMDKAFQQMYDKYSDLPEVFAQVEELANHAGGMLLALWAKSKPEWFRIENQ